MTIRAIIVIITIFVFMKETWKAVKDYEGYYEVSDHGNIRSLDRMVYHGKADKLIKLKGKQLKLINDKFGYQITRLTKARKGKTIKAHRLVAQAFIPNPSNKPQVNHIDGNKGNNHVSNLEWCTQYENNRHAIERGMQDERGGENNNNSKLTEYDVYLIRIMNETMTHKEIAKKFNVSRSTISTLLRGESWADIKTIKV